MILLVTNTLQVAPSGGRELLCKLNHDVLKDIYGDQLLVVELSNQSRVSFKARLNAFKGHIDGLSKAVINNTLRAIQDNNVSKVFVDGSNLGAFVKASKNSFPQLEISTFFHNVEARFFWGAFKQTRSPRALAVFLANYLAEKKSVRYSDKLLCLSERDSRLLHKFYSRTATHISPMALQDKLPTCLELSFDNKPERFALFVGGVFYANRAGIAWFVEHVVPHMGMKICIVGRGFEDLKAELERDGRVEVVGAVDSLAQWYIDAHVVIAPIFDGSGMKTKVAEALMFGKKIVGTPEAFSGYEDVADLVGWVCETAEDFVAAIEQAGKLIEQSYDPDLRALYVEKYSYSAARSRMAMIIGAVS